MLNTVSSCYDQLESLQKLRDLIGPETWCDCIRLIDRCEIFRPYVLDLLNSPLLLEDLDEKTEQCLDELEKALLDAEAYVKEFVNREEFIGITEASYRQGCSMDFSKTVAKLIRLASDLAVGKDSDFDKVRAEDFEVRCYCISCWYPLINHI